ncbi:MAG: hypothetical protein LBG89_01515 [Rickettsiales bacterium]|jgi:diaminopimelate dehydrogenase|nr:hypothetical protein [Rickettsiales bacterium]
MEMTTFAISSLGNIGEAVYETYIKDCEYCMDNGEEMDMKLVGIIRRNARSGETYFDTPVVSDVGNLEASPDVVICCAPSDVVMTYVYKYVGAGYSIVDCYDAHENIYDNHGKISAIAKKNRCVALHTTGWDPGLYSTERSIAYRINPFTKPTTNYGVGRSMGHTTQAKGIMVEFGITDPRAVSITSHFKTEAGILVPGKHQRDLYIELPDWFAQKDELKAALLSDDYFATITKSGKEKPQHTDIHVVDSIAPYDTMRHGGYMLSDGGGYAKMEVALDGDNPTMTSRMMYSGARAVARLEKEMRFGCYLDPQIAPLDFVKGEALKDRMQRVFL